MGGSNLISALTFTIAFLASAINAIPIYKALIALKSQQTVSQYAPEGHQKKQGTPTMGGLIVAIGFVMSALGFTLGNPDVQQHRDALRAVAVVGLFVGFSFIGFVDDYIVPRYVQGKRGLGWKQKITMQFVIAAACGYVLCGSIDSTFFLLVFLVLFFSNAYNFSDGLDTLASLLLIGFGGGLWIFAHMRDATTLEPILAALLGACLPFLYLNRPPAKIFMGDVGSLPIGAVLGVAVTVLVKQNDFDFMFEHPVITGFGIDSYYYRPDCGLLMILGLVIISGMMIVELVPVPLQILSVKLRKKKLFSFTPIHHAFERKGWPEQKVVRVFFACQIAMTALAIAFADNSSTAIVIPINNSNKTLHGIKWHSPTDKPFTLK